MATLDRRMVHDVRGGIELQLLPIVENVNPGPEKAPPAATSAVLIAGAIVAIAGAAVARLHEHLLLEFVFKGVFKL